MPANPANSSVTVEVDVDSFEVRQGTGGVKPLTDADRADIKNTLRGKILNTGQHPTITFGSNQVSGTAESFRIDGDLTIVGVTQPVTVEGQLAAGRALGSAVIVQSRWGIRPYSAFLGALKLRDEVEVRFDVPRTSRPRRQGADAGSHRGQDRRGRPWTVPGFCRRRQAPRPTPSDPGGQVPDPHGMQEVWGSNPHSSTPVQRL